MPPQKIKARASILGELQHNLQAKRGQNHSTQDSRVVPHRGTNWAALWLTAQIGRDAVLSESYGRGYYYSPQTGYKPISAPINKH